MDKRVMLFLCLFCVYSFHLGQRIDNRSSLFSASATVSPGYMFSQKELTYSLHGFAELFVKTDISIKADGYWLLSGENKQSSVSQNTSAFLGGAYHFTREGKLDPWIALQPGVSFVAMKSGLSTSPNSIAPILSSAIGITYQMNRWFNIYIQGRYIAGNVKIEDPYNSSLHEFRVSLGLGFSYIDADKCDTCPHWD